MTPPPLAGGTPVNILGRLVEHVEEAKRHERALKHNSRMLILFKKRLSRMASGHPQEVVG